MNEGQETELIKNVNSTHELIVMFMEKWESLEEHLKRIVKDAKADDEALKQELVELMHEQFMLKEVADEFMKLLLENDRAKKKQLDSIKEVGVSILKVLTAISAVVAAWAHGKGMV